MTKIGRVRFWHLMVGTGFALLAIGLVMIFLPPGVGDSGAFLIEFFEASIESTEMGLALIVLGLSCFLIGRKDLADLRTYQDLQGDLEQTGALAARLVAERVTRTFNGMHTRPARLVSLPDLDLEKARDDLIALQNGRGKDQTLGALIQQAEQGLTLLEALEKEGYSI